MQSRKNSRQTPNQSPKVPAEKLSLMGGPQETIDERKKFISETLNVAVDSEAAGSLSKIPTQKLKDRMGAADILLRTGQLGVGYRASNTKDIEQAIMVDEENADWRILKADPEVLERNVKIANDEAIVYYREGKMPGEPAVFKNRRTFLWNDDAQRNLELMKNKWGITDVSEAGDLLGAKIEDLTAARKKIGNGASTVQNLRKELK
jgi:hypothetical protein